MKYGISSSLVMDLTGNTDFVDTEIDLEPFNLTPLGDLNPFDSVFLILRPVGGGARVVPPCFPSSPEGKNLSDIPSLCLTRASWKAYSCSVKVPQRWQRNERSH
jgi:hypothetical protein